MNRIWDYLTGRYFPFVMLILLVMGSFFASVTVYYLLKIATKG